MELTKSQIALAVKAEAMRLGFDACGIAKAADLTEDRSHLLAWLNAGYHADMSYMDRNLEKRTDPRILVDGAKSVIVAIQNYFPEKHNFRSSYKIAKYAYGEDYHIVLKEKLFSLLNYINKQTAPTTGRCFTDSAPVLERAWAVRAGLGWIGKNANLLTRNFGSFVFIAELIVDLEMEYDSPNVHNYCGSCNLCMEQCPTQAIVSPKTIDGNKCISYQTIENKGEIPEEFRNKTQSWIFGCDICQDVCPWNRKNKPTSEKRFTPQPHLLSFENTDWESMSLEEFDTFFEKSPIKRTGLGGIKRNIQHSK